MTTETILPNTSTDKFQDGYFAAAIHGESLCNNPHPAGTEEADDWAEGWLYANNLDEFQDPIDGSLRSQYSAIEWQH